MEKIRPAVKQSPFKSQDEADLPDLAQAPDPGGVRPEHMVGALSASEAATARAGHGGQNRLGKPFAPNEAEQLLANFQAAKKAWKEEYARTRVEHGEAEEAYFDAKRACMAAGLLDANG